MQKLKTEKKLIAIDKIMVNPFNPNVMSKSIFDKMKQTIQEQGLFGSIICINYGDKYMILDGEHRMKACKELGYTELPVECAEQMNNQEIQFWTIYFNNTKGKDNIEKRSAILDNLSQGQAQLLPFTAEEIQNEKDLFKFDFAQYENTEELTADDFNKVLSMKFTQEEWKLMEEGLGFARQEKLSPKDWFIVQMKNYLDMKLFRQAQSELSTSTSVEN